MPDNNVFVTVSDPDRLIAGESPFAPFVAAKIQLYRWTTEANARAGSTGNGTLVTTFTLIASTQPQTDDAGPFRFGVYDSGLTAGVWYRYRFANTGLSSFSDFSTPWQSDGREQLTLRDLLYEVGNQLAQSVVRGTATAGTTTTVTCAPLFTSSQRDALVYEGAWLMVTRDAGGAAAAPEMEEALIDSVNTGTGVATLDRALSAAIASGDSIIVSTLLQPSEIIRRINLAREEMYLALTADIALTNQEQRYPAPDGVASEADVYDAYGVIQYANTNREDEYPTGFDVEFDGYQGWLIFESYPEETPFIRIRYRKSYRDLEGNLAAMEDTTSARLEWMRAAGAWKCAEALMEDDPGDPNIAQLAGQMERHAKSATARWAPQIKRRMRRRPRQLPGPGAVI